MLTSPETIRAMQIPGPGSFESSVYAIVPKSGPVSFYSQQKRAFNLISALHQAEKLQPGKTVAVVGAGLAGITASAAANMVGCNVTLFEMNQVPFHQQHGNDTRYIHPNVIDWPRPGSSSPDTDLPFLNWTADFCESVVDEIEDQWRTLNVTLEPNRKVRVEQLESDGVYITATNPYYHEKFNIVIISVGFGDEDKFGLEEQKSYWSSDDWHQLLSTRNKTIFVSGTGDGGLIDAMRLVLLKFDHRAILESVMEHKPLLEIGDRLLAADDEAREVLKDESKDANPQERANRASNLLWHRYNELKIAERLPEMELRHNYRRIILNSPLPTPLNLNASIINRVLVHGLVVRGVIDYEGGSLHRFPENVFCRQVNLQRSVDDTINDINDIIIRHGPVGALNSVIGKELAAAYFRNSDQVDQAGRQESWHSTKFEVPTDFEQSPTISWHRALRIKPAFEAHLNELGIAYRSLRLQQVKEGEGPAYFVSLDKTNIAKLKARGTIYRRIPIIAEIERDVSIEQPRLPQAVRLRPLVCGSGIGAWAMAGTLGFFVKMPDGKPALVSAAHVLNRLDGEATEQLVTQPWAMSIEDRRTDNVVATVTKVLPLDRNGVNRFDIGYAQLRPGIEFVQCFQPHLQLPAPRRIRNLDSTVFGEDVWVVCADKVLRGRVMAIEISTSGISYNSGQIRFEHLFMISELEGNPDHGAVSGSVVTTLDGTLLGMVFAGSVGEQRKHHLFAFELAPALEELGCQFIPFVDGVS
jgi:hypothetical protein